MGEKCGKLVISLDFELFWGVCDKKTVAEFKADMDGGRKGIPMLLELFEKYGIHATWGVVGMLFSENKSELKEYFPKIKPSYQGIKSAYEHFDSIGENENEDCYHYAPSLIEKILKYKNQEIGSHTFAHYYCKENGQDIKAFEADVASAKEIARRKYNLDMKSFIFPRNQFNPEYLVVLKKYGFSSVRGNLKNFAFNGSSLLRRMMRLVDTYIPVCGNKFYEKSDCDIDGITNIRASIFFRKYNHRLRFFEFLKMHSVKHQMKKAAKNGKVLHIWWHPHNMGRNLEIFLKQIEEILLYYKKMNVRYGFESKNMGELAEEILNEKNSYSL